MNEPIKIKPVIILPPGEMTQKDIAELKDNGFCVVVAKRPDAVRFMEPPLQSYPAPERAALKLVRFIVANRTNGPQAYNDLTERLCDYLIEGTPLQKQAVTPVPQVQIQVHPALDQPTKK